MRGGLSRVPTRLAASVPRAGPGHGGGGAPRLRPQPTGSKRGPTRAGAPPRRLRRAQDPRVSQGSCERRTRRPARGALRAPPPQRRDEATKIKQNEPLLNFSFFKDKDWKGPSRALSLRAPTPGRRGCHRPLRPRTGAAGARALRAPGRPRSSEAGQRREAAAGRVGTEPTVHKTHRARALPPLQKGSRSSRDTRRGGGGGSCSG